MFHSFGVLKQIVGEGSGTIRGTSRLASEMQNSQSWPYVGLRFEV